MIILLNGPLGIGKTTLAEALSSTQTIADLTRRLAATDEDFKCFLLTLPLEENLRRIQCRASARALDELAFEQRTVRREREALGENPDAALGVPFDVSAPHLDP